MAYSPLFFSRRFAALAARFSLRFFAGGVLSDFDLPSFSLDMFSNVSGDTFKILKQKSIYLKISEGTPNHSKKVTLKEIGLT